MSNIAVFGGTFNPIHNGHIHLIKTVLKNAVIDKIIVMPTNIPPHKNITDPVSDEDRYEMCRLAVEDMCNVMVSDYEIKKNDISFTINTMRHMKILYPNDKLFFIMGSDMLFSFTKWQGYTDILNIAEILVVSREYNDCKKLIECSEGLKACGGKITVIQAEPYVISSSLIRDKIKSKENFSCYLPEKIVKYIMNKELYMNKTNDSIYPIEEYIQIAKERLSKKRFNHSVYVAEEALKLAKRWSENENKAYVAGILHDICKEIPPDEQKKMVDKSDLPICPVEKTSPPLWHGIAASWYIKDVVGIRDSDIINAVRYHTCARSSMSRLEEIIYIADLISADRTYKDVDKIRKLAYTSLGQTMLEGLRFSIADVLAKSSKLPMNTVEAYNQYSVIKVQ